MIDAEASEYGDNVFFNSMKEVCSVVGISSRQKQNVMCESIFNGVPE